MASDAALDGDAIAPTRPYAWYALGVMATVYAVNFVDRQIISILAEDIKLSLKLSDAQLGFLYGTAFAIFYTIFGIPLGRLADSWYRGRLMALGLAIWSLMTTLSGFAHGFVQLAVARVGVGVGEASASPAAFSMLADYFPKNRRALAMGVYSAGIYIGGGLSLPLGGWIAQTWNHAYAAGHAPLGLFGWQAAFLAVGVPGLILAVVVMFLKEPLRGESDGSPAPIAQPGAWRAFALEMAAILPPLTLWSVSRYPGALRLNIAVGAAVAAAAWLLVKLTGDLLQWGGYAVGIYAVFSWAQMLRNVDRPAYQLIWGTPTAVLCVLGIGSLSFYTYSLGFWGAPYAMRTLHATKQAAGLFLGLPAAASSAMGVVIGGRISDAWKARDPRGRIFVCMVSNAAPAPVVFFMYTSHNFTTFAVLAALMAFVSSMWIGSSIAVFQDLVLPRMRGMAGATYTLGTTMVGLALGPYLTGKVATLTGSIPAGVFSLYLMMPLTLLVLWLVSRGIGAAEATKVQRAAAV